METSRFLLALCAATVVAASFLAGCGSATTTSLTLPSSVGSNNGQAAQTRRPRSWMLPKAKTQDLLYVSNSSTIITVEPAARIVKPLTSETGVVDVYTFGARKNAGKGSGSKHVGQLTDFSVPSGQCVDGSGDVFIGDWYNQRVLEYAHAGSTPINTFATEGDPIGCSVDPKSGNLAVSVFYYSGDSSGQGAIEVFNGSQAAVPTVYVPPNIYWPFPPGYDPNGNLFF